MSNKMRKKNKGNKENAIKISACMMIKDEEDNLGRCLSSIKDIVDEIIVVDTGSTDNSIKICKEFGAKVYNHPWEDNFSLHRNQSISYATGDWILIIDADEEFVLDNVEKAFLVKQLKKVPDGIDGAAVLFKDMQKNLEVMQFNSTRFYKKGCIRYEGIVHNQPVMKSGKKAGMLENIHMLHYGYDLTPEEKEAKTIRTKGLLEKRIDNDPDDHLAHFYLMQLYSDNKDYENAIKHGEKYIGYKDKAEKAKLFMDTVYYCMVRNYMYLENKEKTEWWLNRGIKELPDDIDLAMALIEYGSWQRRGDLLVTGANKFLELYDKYEKNLSMKGSRFVYSFTPEGKAFCLFHLSAFNIAQTVTSLNKLKEIVSDTKMKKEYSEGITRDMKRLIEATKADRIHELFEEKSFKEKSIIIPNMSSLNVAQ